MSRPRGSKADLPKAPFTKANVREALSIFRYLRPYRGPFIFGLLFIALGSLTTLAFPYLLKSIVDSATPGTKLAYTPGQIAMTMIGVLVLQMLFSFMRIYLFTRVGEHAVADMRKDIYRRIIAMPMGFFAQRRTGELSSRIAADVTQIQDTLTSSFAEVLRGILTLIVGIGLILFISPKLTLLMLSVVPVVVAIALIFGRYIRKSSRDAQDRLADSNIVVQESLQGIATVKAFTSESYETGRYNRSINAVVDLAVKNGVMRGTFASTMIFTVFGTVVLVVWYSIYTGIPTSSLIAFVVYTAFISGTMAGFAELFSNLQKTLGATQRVRELLNDPVEPLSMESAPILPSEQIGGNVRFDDVHFSYPSRKELTVLRGVNLEAGAGQQIALVGPSGAGKSTVAALLLQFYSPDSGTIFFDGKPATDISLGALRRQMAYVPQDVLLFGGTIFENIAYGSESASQGAVEAAARQANAHQFITSFPEGYQTMVGERGVQLSGGQRQRIAIARAILRDPKILILDEATSALDSESEALVQEALLRLMQNRTSFVIAHRLSTIRNADKIVVLDGGLVRESGTHTELMMLDGGLYQQLSRMQFEVASLRSQ
jgi:ABC-type multidrug transport system fused ATPase/permease subunit